MTITQTRPQSAVVKRIQHSGQITGHDAVLLLREVVYAKGADHCAESCHYFTPEIEEVYACNAQPVCILGHAFALLGKDRDDLHTLHGDANGENICDVTVYGLYLTPEAVEVFTAAQDVQDGYQDWGTALEAAEEKLKDMQFAAATAVDNATDGIDAGPTIEDLADAHDKALYALTQFATDKALGIRLRRALELVIDTGSALVQEVAK